MIQYPRRLAAWPAFPPSADRTSAHPEKISAKCLRLKILQGSPVDSRFCAGPLVFSIFYEGRGEGGRSVSKSQSPVTSRLRPVSGQLPVVRGQGLVVGRRQGTIDRRLRLTSYLPPLASEPSSLPEPVNARAQIQPARLSRHLGRHEIQPSRNLFDTPSSQPQSGAYGVSPGRKPPVGVEEPREPRSGDRPLRRIQPRSGLLAKSDQRRAKGGLPHAR